MLIGPLGFHPENVNTMALEDIISFRSMEPLNQALEGELDAAELELFQQQLLKNFSLQSLMENLTILNPARLLDCVYEAVSALQRQMNRRFQSRTLVGIYIHVSFLIERLVTRTAIESLADLTPFVQTSSNRSTPASRRCLRITTSPFRSTRFPISTTISKTTDRTLQGFNFQEEK